MTAQPPLYERDPDEYQRKLAEGNATQPRKRASADILWRDSDRRVLLVRPTYKPEWDLPGGMSEANEDPVSTVRREIREELGLDVQVGRLLCVDWVAPHGPWDDLVAFLFDGGVLSSTDAARIRLTDGEIAAFEFCSETAASERLQQRTWRRLRAALEVLETGHFQYLQDGQPVP